MIILSYAEEDVAIAREVADEFRQKGIDVYDWHDADNRGGRFMERIEAQIREAEAFVALVSGNYLASPWCRRERELAMLREMGAPAGHPAPGFLYILKIADTPFGDAGFLQAYDGIDLMHVRDLTEKLAGITATIRPGGELLPAIPGLSAAGRESSFFRNRQEELERVRHALTNSAGPHFWLVIAPPQLGKTWLMDRISATLTFDVPQPWTTKLVDLRQYPHERLTDAGLLLGQLFGKAIPVAIEDEKLADIAAEIIASRRPHLCLLDSAELLGKDTAATLRSCLTKIYHYVRHDGQAGIRLAVIVASRRDDEWRGIIPDPRLEALRLTEFTVNVVQETLYSLGTQMGARFEDETYRRNAARVHRLSEGLPALQVRCLEWIQAHQWAGMERLESEELFAELAQPYIKQRLLSQESLIAGAPGQLRRERRALEEAFRVLSPYRVFTQSHLRHYLQRDPLLSTAMHDAEWAIEDLWEAIGGTALLWRPLNEPWQEPHRAIRRLLYRYYYMSARSRIEAHREAQEFVRSWTGGLTGKDQIIGIIEWLWHQATVLRLTGSAQPDEELCKSASSFCQSLAKSSYSKQEVHDYAADVMFNDDELAGVVSGNGVLERLITIIEDIGSTV